MKPWNQKVVLLVETFHILYVMGITLTHDGQPGCKTDNELATQFYRNLWDPTGYWLCSKKNTPGLAKQCPGGTAFFDELKACVPWDDWEWTELEEPPSRPDSSDTIETKPVTTQSPVKTTGKLAPPKRASPPPSPSPAKRMRTLAHPGQRLARMNRSRQVIKVIKDQGITKRLIKVRKARRDNNKV